MSDEMNAMPGQVQEKKRKNIRGAFLGSCEPDIDSNEPADADLLLLSEELNAIRASRASNTRTVR